MIKKILLGMMLISLFQISCNSKPSLSAKPKLVVVLVVDQMPPDLLTRFDALYTGGFRWLIDHGTWFTNTHHEHGYTATGPGHFVIGSGRYPGPNGMMGNIFYDPILEKKVNCVEDPNAKVIENTGDARSYSRYTNTALSDWIKASDSLSKVYSIAGKDRSAVLMGGQKPDLAVYYNYDGQFITSDYYTNKNPKWLTNFNTNLDIASFKDSLWTRSLDTSLYLTYARPDFFDGEVDEYLTDPYSPTFPIGIDSSKEAKTYFMGRPWFERSILDLANVLVQAESLGQDEHSDLLFIGFSAMDWMIHDYGPFSQEIMDAMIKLDGYLGNFINRLDQEIGLENIQFILTADHGGLPLPEYLQEQGIEAGRYNKEEIEEAKEWIEDEIEERYGKDLFTRSGLQYFLNDENIKKAEVNPDSIVAIMKKYLLKIDGIAQVFTPNDVINGDQNNPIISRYMNMLHPIMSPDVFSIPEKNWVYRTFRGTSHGAPYDYDTHVPLLFSHENNACQENDTKIETVDIAPTIAKILNVAYPDLIDGKPILIDFKLD
ncbi:MAG: hypothetical protein HN462_06465 [Candidatus Marinimicrobia bacterium]|nr:hypothetical protein [Candidatus Neomarinimicrobiota bacterium]MBT4592969.1 hypothetical protein [Candidatus Neomarinimicrobiota bacterium]MBT6158907.1 hypothetical protein [Candidatus Neomarinimicrobiota bacterium]